MYNVVTPCSKRRADGSVKATQGVVAIEKGDLFGGSDLRLKKGTYRYALVFAQRQGELIVGRASLSDPQNKSQDPWRFLRALSLPEIRTSR